ncbi:ABC transporter substrate-binding protein [Streptococcus pneumoniae]|nr:ABC transporter substrate-binding protein [Streptococcus pneumoniae]
MRIGISQFITHQSLDATREEFVDELAKQGYVEGENIEIDLQNAQGEQRNLKTISQQLAESSDVVLAIARPSAQSLANTTQTTPVIFSAVTDPVSAKLVESREHPGGNVTGTSDQSSDAISTQINLIKKVLPKAKTIGILYTQSEPNSVVQKDEAKRLLKEKGFTVVEKTILDSNNVKAAAESLMAEVDMVFVPTDNIISLTMETVKQVSIKHKVPVFGGSTEMIAVGGLYNY